MVITWVNTGSQIALTPRSIISLTIFAVTGAICRPQTYADQHVIGLTPSLLRPTIDVVLNILSRFHRIVAGNALEQQPFHFRQRSAPR